jgi:hypothetical protein
MHPEKTTHTHTHTHTDTHTHEKIGYLWSIFLTKSLAEHSLPLSSEPTHTHTDTHTHEQIGYLWSIILTKSLAEHSLPNVLLKILSIYRKHMRGWKGYACNMHVCMCICMCFFCPGFLAVCMCVYMCFCFSPFLYISLYFRTIKNPSLV